MTDRIIPTLEHFTMANRVGARLITAQDAEWPDQLSVLGPDAPVALWVRGTARLDTVTQRAITIVGSRAATGYGEHVSVDFGYGLAGERVTVVTGGRYGIEGAALRGALIVGGSTPVAVLPCGIDITYPSGHANLFDQVTTNGLLVSEYLPGTPPARHRFIERGRLLAALTAGTVVIEAAIRSGARAVATRAAALNRPVMAVPGPITSAMSAGCHELIRAGTAIPVASVADILDTVGRALPEIAP